MVLIRISRNGLEIRIKKESKLNELLRLKRKVGNKGTKVGKSFNTVNVRSDGNCFYRCLSMFFENREEGHERYRDRIVNHIADNKKDYSCYIDGDVDEHVIRQGKTTGEVSSWATEAEILAAAQVFRAEIHVYMDGLTSEPAKFTGLKAGGIYKHQISLQLQNQHFNLLQMAGYGTDDSDDSHMDSIHSKENESNGIDWFEMGHKLKEERTAPMKKLKGDDHNDNGAAETNRRKQHDGKEKRELKESMTIVTNKSKRKLERSEEQLLSKGFSFVPTRRKVNMVRLLSDLAEWERRMRLTEYFYDKEKNDYVGEGKEKLPWEKKNSDFTPQAGRDKWVNMYIEVVKDDILKSMKTKMDMNISRNEEKAMRKLMDDASIVIRPADKGSGIVIVDTEEYVKELKLEVDGNSLYEKCETDNTKEAERSVKKIFEQLYKQEAICKDLKTYMTPKHPKAGRLKENPKLHKKNAPYRAIVSGIGTATENMAEVAEKELNEFVINTPSYVQRISSTN